VLVTRHGAHIQAKITDFGVSQSMQFTSKQCETSMSGDRHPNSSNFGMYSMSTFFGIVGTTGWRAPEVFRPKVCLLFKHRLLYLLGIILETQMHIFNEHTQFDFLGKAIW
jgi:serine/threonine protein kinase